jgi:hypothetical protein
MPAMVDRPATNSTLLTVASGQAFSTNLIPTAVGNATRVFDVDAALTDTSISGAYIDEIWFQYTKRSNIFTDAQAASAGTYSQTGTAQTVTLANHNLQVGQKAYLDYTSGTGVDETLTVTSVTATTFAGTSATTTTTTGNVSVYLPIDVCFYLVSTASITNTNQFYPLFVASIPATFDNQYFSLTEKNILPLINHPVVQSGANFTSTNSTTSPKIRGLMLQRGQAIYAAVSGPTSLTNGFYLGVQAGYY